MALISQAQSSFFAGIDNAKVAVIAGAEATSNVVAKAAEGAE